MRLDRRLDTGRAAPPPAGQVEQSGGVELAPRPAVPPAMKGGWGGFIPLRGTFSRPSRLRSPWTSRPSSWRSFQKRIWLATSLPISGEGLPHRARARRGAGTAGRIHTHDLELERKLGVPVREALAHRDADGGPIRGRGRLAVAAGAIEGAPVSGGRGLRSPAAVHRTRESRSGPLRPGGSRSGARRPGSGCGTCPNSSSEPVCPIRAVVVWKVTSLGALGHARPRSPVRHSVVSARGR